VLIITQQSTQALSTHHLSTVALYFRPGCQKVIVETLIIPLMELEEWYPVHAGLGPLRAGSTW
jgi:hypothetical protein